MSDALRVTVVLVGGESVNYTVAADQANAERETVQQTLSRPDGLLEIPVRETVTRHNADIEHQELATTVVPVRAVQSVTFTTRVARAAKR